MGAVFSPLGQPYRVLTKELAQDCLQHKHWRQSGNDTLPVGRSFATPARCGVEYVSDLGPTVKSGFEECLPFKRACLNNKTRNPIPVGNLYAEFILTIDAKLRSRFPQEQSLYWFREPYATVILVTCEDLDEFKTILKPRLKLLVQNEEKEWFIVFVSRAHPSDDQASKMAKKVYAKLEVDFSSKKRKRCCKLDIHGLEENFWEDLESKSVESIRNTLDRRVQFYEEEIRKLSVKTVYAHLELL